MSLAWPCALACERPCPTFRLPVDGKLVVPHQAQLIPTNDAYVGSDARELVAAS